MSALSSFRYCPNCATGLTVKDNRLQCSACQFVLYDNPRACTALLLRNEHDEILLVRRANEPSRGLFDLPGGFVNAGETLEAGAKRELFEELDIEIGQLTYVGSYPDTYPYKDVTYDTIGAVFTARLGNNLQFKLDDELLGYQFFKYQDLPWNDLAFPSVRDILKQTSADLTVAS